AASGLRRGGAGREAHAEDSRERETASRRGTSNHFCWSPSSKSEPDVATCLVVAMNVATLCDVDVSSPSHRLDRYEDVTHPCSADESGGNRAWIVPESTKRRFWSAYRARCDGSRGRSGGKAGRLVAVQGLGRASSR